jgi:hypothetical protein
MQYTQKTLEQYFVEFGITDPDRKAMLLPSITDLIYDRNIHVINFEKETDEYKRNQIEQGIIELDIQIKNQFETL